MKWVLTACNQFPIQAVFMRVLSCHCSSLDCFSKSPVGLYSPPALKLEDARHASSSPPLVAAAAAADASEEKLSDEKVEVEKAGLDDVKVEIFLKSSLKKVAESGSAEVVKGRVKWMDFLGKELAEIKEFETSEPGDLDDDDDANRGCVCVIQ